MSAFDSDLPRGFTDADFETRDLEASAARQAARSKRGSATVDGVTIAWLDSRYMGSDHDDPTDDMDLRGEYRVSVSVKDGDISKIDHAFGCAKRLQMLSGACDLMCPVPGSTHVLKLAGLDDMGSPMWRVIANERVCDAIPAGEMAHMDPARYTNAGKVAMRTIAWMRAVGRITSDWKTKEETWHVLHVWDDATLKAAMLQFCRPEGREITVAD
jgi:hypothetical protein